AAFQREAAVLEDQRCNLHQHSSGRQVDRVHGSSTNRPSFERPTQRLSLLVGRRSGSSLAAQGSPKSRPRVRQSLTVLTCLHCASSSCRTAARSDVAPSRTSRASWSGWRTPTSLSNSKTALSGSDTSGPSDRCWKRKTRSGASGG